jgi:uncharacterized protein (TIGR01319 family)
MNSKPVSQPVNSIIATDCGSTTTKAILILRREDGSYRLAGRGEAPTTVEAPFDDVNIGVINAMTELQEISGRQLVDNGRLIIGERPDRGADLYLSTSSAGGGLQMAVTGIVGSLSAESAERAALGAGAIIIDSFTYDDNRNEQQRVERIRHIRPDMVLFAGGTDGGAETHLVEMAETLLMADPKPRFGELFKIPLIYAANRNAFPLVKDILEDAVELMQVNNVRPSMEMEDLNDAGQAIHRLFLEHVMAQAPGYDELMQRTSTPIMPTPSAFGKCIQAVGEHNRQSVLAVDIGGATTDVFSVFDDRFTRTVSANYGMSYNICNVVKETGVANVISWLPFEVTPEELWDMTLNKMIRPTTIPQTREELLMEQAVVREALRLSFTHHLRLAVGLKGVVQQRSVSDAFEQKEAASVIDLRRLNLVIGSGGALSHAPRRIQTAIMMLDAFALEGVTELAVDSIFMMPHLGVLAQSHPEIAMEVLHRDCLIPIGTSISLSGAVRWGKSCASFSATDGKNHVLETLHGGELYRFPFPNAAQIAWQIEPRRGVDAGNGPGEPVSGTSASSTAGIIVDARGRPLVLPKDPVRRCTQLRKWLTSVEAFSF